MLTDSLILQAQPTVNRINFPTFVLGTSRLMAVMLRCSSFLSRPHFRQLPLLDQFSGDMDFVPGQCSFSKMIIFRLQRLGFLFSFLNFKWTLCICFACSVAILFFSHGFEDELEYIPKLFLFSLYFPLVVLHDVLFISSWMAVINFLLRRGCCKGKGRDDTQCYSFDFFFFWN